MSIALLGLITSILTSIVKWLNTRLENTPLKGNAAVLVSVLISFLGAVGYMYWNDTLNLSNKLEFTKTFTMIFATADLYYRFIVEKFFNRN